MNLNKTLWVFIWVCLVIMKIFKLFILSHTGISERDRNRSNARVDSLPQTIDENVSLIDIDHFNILDSEEIFPDTDEVSQEIEALNKRVHQLISLRKQKEMEKENETKKKLIERDRLLRQIADLELFTQEEPKSKEEVPIIRENLTAKISSTLKVVVQLIGRFTVNQIPLGLPHNQSNQVPRVGGPNSRMNTGNICVGNQFQRRPINVELYRQLFFYGIPGYPNHVPIEMRKKI